MDLSIILEQMRPELLTLVIFSWVVGKFLKTLKTFPDEFIPTFIWGTSILFSFLYLRYMIQNDASLTQTIITSFVEGTFIAGIAVFGNQQIKQLGKRL